jgi:hypothetical protein
MRNLGPLNEGQRTHETPGVHPELILDRLYHAPSPRYLNTALVWLSRAAA